MNSRHLKKDLAGHVRRKLSTLEQSTFVLGDGEEYTCEVRQVTELQTRIRVKSKEGGMPVYFLVSLKEEM